MVYKTFSAYDIAISDVVIIIVIRLIISAYDRYCKYLSALVVGTAGEVLRTGAYAGPDLGID